MPSSADEPPLPTPLAHAWGIEKVAGTRGPKPRLTLELIIDASVAVAAGQQDGSPSLSRVAQRLGVSTPALYRYVSSRAELDMLLGERGLGPPPEISDAIDWRAGVHAWVRALKERHRLHPWLIDVQAYVPMLPRVLAWLDALLTTLIDSGMTPHQAVRAAVAVDSYVRASVSLDRATRRLPIDGTPETWFNADVVRTVACLARARHLEQVAHVLEHGIFQSETTDDGGFTAGLELLLDGLESQLANSTQPKDPGPT